MPGSVGVSNAAEAMRGGDRQVGGRFGDPQAAGDVEVDVGLRSAAGRQRVSSTASSIDSRPLSQPITDRRGEPPGLGASSAWTSTSTGRVPSRPANTALPAMLPRRSARNRAEGLATSARPASVISNTPISSVAPKRFFTRAQDAELVAAVAFEIQHRVDHVLQHARAGDGAVLGDVADQHDGEVAGLGQRGSARSAQARTWRDGAGGAVDGVEPHGLDASRSPPAWRRAPAPGWRRCRAR